MSPSLAVPLSWSGDVMCVFTNECSSCVAGLVRDCLSCCGAFYPRVSPLVPCSCNDWKQARALRRIADFVHRLSSAAAAGEAQTLSRTDTDANSPPAFGAKTLLGSSGGQKSFKMMSLFRTLQFAALLRSARQLSAALQLAAALTGRPLDVREHSAPQRHTTDDADRR
jgi:hypothetical protein